MLSPSCSIVTRENINIIQVNNAFASAEVALFGAHMLSFIPKHDLRERFWLSKATKLDGLQAIRGGVPICWPWFGDHAIKQQEPANKDFPSHGYVRTQVWQIVHTLDTPEGTEIVLQPTSSQGHGFSGVAQLKLVITIGERCSLQLMTTNAGKERFSYRCALHSYFKVDNINHVRLSGLSGDYLDKTRSMQSYTTPNPYGFSAETDRVHLCQPESVTIDDENTLTEIHSQGHDSLVIWNPWQEKSISMSDMENEGYLTMVCVETAVTQGQWVEPGESHVLTQIIA